MYIKCPILVKISSISEKSPSETDKAVTSSKIYGSDRRELHIALVFSPRSR